jgi:glucan 1,3-beta-glucosidase
MIFSTRITTSAIAATALLASVSNAAPAMPMSRLSKRDLPFDFGNEKVRGVNLGGWLVLEPWITPSIFEATPGNVVDGKNAQNWSFLTTFTNIATEYTYGEQYGSDTERLRDHWNSWITEDDFSEIASVGLNFVRLPIGYWSIIGGQGAPYVQGAYDYVGKAVGWAGNHGIKVMLDLHGAPRSQNGFDNSGQLKSTPEWTQLDSVEMTLKALNKLRDDFGDNPNVAAIELLNEPLGPALDMDTVRQFYMDGWGNLKNTNVAVTFHDAFEGVTSWNDWGSGMWNLLLDTHHYEVFDSGALAMSPDEHVGTACGFGSQMATNNKWTIAGEWSGALTDCAKVSL